MSNISNPTARHLLMNLLLAADGGSLSAADAVAAARLFGISGNATRVALARLASVALIDAVGRGRYRLGPGGMALAEEVSTWRSAEEKMRPWDGGWIVVVTGGLPRNDRAALRMRDRALGMLGLREMDAGLFIRPDNLAGGAAALRTRLQALGVGEDAPVFRAVDFDSGRERGARMLWAADDLAHVYRDWLGRIDNWLGRAGELPLGNAARESFLLGDAAIRQLVFDPLLPEPLIDVQLRRAFREAVIRLDDAGRGIWRRYLAGAEMESASG
ncbi:MAG TPA: PaaX family transcriptional regulator C-terminal domain-containing protein [Rhizobiaceae bacterium]|nr:PaaX family transcriptional regulator C-terminal domain-containing protein [Rhizobiaceae bacterium]